MWPYWLPLMPLTQMGLIQVVFAANKVLLVVLFACFDELTPSSISFSRYFLFVQLSWMLFRMLPRAKLLPNRNDVKSTKNVDSIKGWTIGFLFINLSFGDFSHLISSMLCIVMILLYLVNLWGASLWIYLIANGNIWIQIIDSPWQHAVISILSCSSWNTTYSSDLSLSAKEWLVLRKFIWRFLKLWGMSSKRVMKTNQSFSLKIATLSIDRFFKMLYVFSTEMDVVDTTLVTISLYRFLVETALGTVLYLFFRSLIFPLYI